MKRIASLVLVMLLLLSGTAFAADISEGDYVTFGSYEQANGRGREPIEWLVLDEHAGAALLISRYGLEAKVFNGNSGGQTWSNCALRTWLNGTFYRTAFSAAEREAILITRIDESSSQCSSAFPPARVGNDTDDYVFILSYAESVKYLGNVSDRKCIPTGHTVSAGGNKSDGNYLNGRKTCWYWLRSPAYKNNAVVVDWDGSYNTCYISHPYGVVRPCIWVDVDTAF